MKSEHKNQSTENNQTHESESIQLKIYDVNRNQSFDPNIGTKLWGMVNMACGLVEASLGATCTYGTGSIGAFAGCGALFAHGLDGIYSGGKQVWHGLPQESLTYQAVNSILGNMGAIGVDIGISMLGGGSRILALKPLFVEYATKSYYKTNVRSREIDTDLNSDVLYSGFGNNSIANIFAQLTNKKTIEMTNAGKWLQSQHVSYQFGWHFEETLWVKLSERYAKKAEGNVYAFIHGASENRIYYRIERPILIKNPKVTELHEFKIPLNQSDIIKLVNEVTFKEKISKQTLTNYTTNKIITAVSGVTAAAKPNRVEADITLDVKKQNKLQPDHPTLVVSASKVKKPNNNILFFTPALQKQPSSPMKSMTMRKEKIEAIKIKIGSADAPGLINKLNSLGVGDDIELIDFAIRIPKAVVNDISAFQSELSSLSKVGRSFEITEESEKLIIDIIKTNPSYVPEEFPKHLPEFLDFLELSTHPKSTLNHSENEMTVEKTSLPSSQEDAKLLTKPNSNISFFTPALIEKSCPLLNSSAKKQLPEINSVTIPPKPKISIKNIAIAATTSGIAANITTNAGIGFGLIATSSELSFKIIIDLMALNPFSIAVTAFVGLIMVLDWFTRTEDPIFGGYFDFTKNWDRFNFKKHNESTLWVNQSTPIVPGNLGCRADTNVSTPGVLREMYLIPGWKHLLQVTGWAEEGVNAYLYVGDRNKNFVWSTAKLPNGQRGTVEIEFTAPATTEFCRVGVLFSGPKVGQKFWIDNLIIAPIDYPKNEYRKYPVAAKVKSRIGGFFNFNYSCGLGGFATSSGSTIYLNNLGQLVCKANHAGSTPGVERMMNLIPNRKHVLLVKGMVQGEGKGKAYLWIEYAHGGWETVALPTDKSADVELEFIAPDQGKRLSSCRVGVLFTGQSAEQSFILDHFIVAPVDCLEKEIDGHPIAVPGIKSTIGGYYHFAKGGYCGFIGSGSKIYLNSAGLLSCEIISNDSTPGLERKVTCIPGQKHILRVTGSASPGAKKAYLWVNINGYFRKEETALPTECVDGKYPPVEMEFIVPNDPNKSVISCRMGVLFEGPAQGQRLWLENFIVAPVDCLEKEIDGHLIAVPGVVSPTLQPENEYRQMRM